jgi:hypothetical protein
MSMTESLTLVVRKEVAGVLDTNISEIENFVTERIKDYAPESYMGDADMAKKDRAELNKAKKALGEARKSVIDRLMKPYRDFESRCKALEGLIDTASGKLDAIVKEREAEEKEAKRALIQTEWDSRNFDLVPLDKVFNPKWLNKTYKLTDIANEMTVIIERTYKDLKTIEKFADDAETLKAHYLMCLDIGDTLDYGEELKKKRELAEREAKERAEREHIEHVNEQKKELAQEQKDFARKSSVAGLVADASGEELEPAIGEYVLNVSVTESQLLGIKNYLNMQGIEFECRSLEF